VLKSKELAAVFMLSSFASFANTNDDLNAYQAQGLRQAATVSSAKIQTLKEKSAYTLAEHETLIDGFLKQARASQSFKQQTQAAPNAILLVSFSMPEALLLALSDEAAAFNIPVVINGLVDGDFKKTIETFARLHAEAKKQRLNFKGVSIDPLWFEQFQIKAVPALVLSERPASCAAQTLCANQTFDVVYGNASIKKALALIRDKGDAASSLAKTILEQGHV